MALETAFLVYNCKCNHIELRIRYKYKIKLIIQNMKIKERYLIHNRKLRYLNFVKYSFSVSTYDYDEKRQRILNLKNEFP